MSKKFRPRRPVEAYSLAGEVKRGYIPLSVRVGDSPKEISELYGVSYGTACVWMRIINGPKYN